MEFTVSERDGMVVLRVTGSIHAEDNDDFAEALEDLRRSERYRVVFDGEKLDYLNSRALGTLVAFSRDARVGGGRLVISRPSPTARNILKSVGLLSLIPVFEQVEDALAYLRKDLGAS